MAEGAPSCVAVYDDGGGDGCGDSVGGEGGSEGGGTVAVGVLSAAARSGIRCSSAVSSEPAKRGTDPSHHLLTQGS